MSEPVYRDPVWDGASDPTVIRREGTDEWWMFYTQRRALLDAPGVAWVHGSRIGVAVSTDGGGSWEYRGVVEGLDKHGESPSTHWAPEVVRLDGRYHLYLTWIEGIPAEWAGHERRIIHYASDDLLAWQRIGVLDLGSPLVIDAAVHRCADGLRMWFKDEREGSTTWSAVSGDGDQWRREGLVIGGRPHEGVNVFELGGAYWLIVDEWRGQGVYRSEDGRDWRRQTVADGLILGEPGKHPDDRQVGRHADAVVRGDDAAIFYFTHPGWNGDELEGARGVDERRSAVHTARLTVEQFGAEKVLVADRDPEDWERILPTD